MSRVRETKTLWADEPLRLYALLILALFGLLTARLFQLQVVKRDEHQIRSIGNVIQDFRTPAPRGDIYDRAGRPLAKNKQVFKLLYVRPPDLGDYILDPKEGKRLRELKVMSPLAETEPGQRQAKERQALERQAAYLNGKTGESLREIQQLSVYLGQSYDQLMKRCERETRRTYGNVPITLVDSLSYAQVVFIEENRDIYPRLLIDEYAFQRDYPLGTSAAHLVGYTSLMGQSESDSMQALGYPQDETVGKDGAERAYEAHLHGRPGIRYIKLDRSGLGVDFLRLDPDDRSSAQYQVNPVKGSDLFLTVDSRLQKKAEATLGGMRGAAIVCALMPGHEGEILALASTPSYDPARIREGDYYSRLATDEYGTPLVNRATQLAFEPGSTFKIATMSAALQSETYTPDRRFYCPGKLKIGNRDFKCHHLSGHGGINLMMGFAESCDVVFYNIGLNLPRRPGTLNDFARRFGYGSRTGIDLAGEASGLVPDEAYKRKNMMAMGIRKETDLKWYDGDNANFSIGQGSLKATPLQVLWSANIVAWGGKSWAPTLLYGRRADSRLVRSEHTDQSDCNLDPGVLATVKQAMRLAVTSGTCKLLNISGMEVCAKSGTAETGNKGESPHSWVVGFYPASAPQYAFVLFVQNGGSSTEAAIPAAKNLLEYMKSNAPIDQSKADKSQP
jgi:penicillin-binding protein 2